MLNMVPCGLVVFFFITEDVFFPLGSQRVYLIDSHIDSAHGLMFFLLTCERICKSYFFQYFFQSS